MRIPGSHLQRCCALGAKPLNQRQMALPANTDQRNSTMSNVNRRRRLPTAPTAPETATDTPGSPEVRMRRRIRPSGPPEPAAPAGPSKPSSDYAVGYGRPPVHTRFKEKEFRT